MWEDLLLEYNIIISLPCRKVCSGTIPIDYISKFPFIMLYVIKKQVLGIKKLINERFCESQQIISHCHKKVMQENLINYIFQKV